MKKLVPILFALIGFTIGGGIGFVTRTPPEQDSEQEGIDAKKEEAVAKHSDNAALEDRAYVKMNNQFVIPVLGTSRVAALVVLSISLEVSADDTEIIYTKEPKLRDAFIEVLFDYAYAGGFGADFVASANLDALKMRLLEAAEIAMPQKISDVLITDLVRQDT